MNNEELIDKMKEDMKMRNFSKYTYGAYLRITKDVIRYFNKPLEEVTIEELRNYLLKHLKDKRKLSDRSINYYNSIIRFVYDVTLDKVINNALDELIKCYIDGEKYFSNYKNLEYSKKYKEEKAEKEAK